MAVKNATSWGVTIPTETKANAGWPWFTPESLAAGQTNVGTTGATSAAEPLSTQGTVWGMPISGATATGQVSTLGQIAGQAISGQPGQPTGGGSLAGILGGLQNFFQSLSGIGTLTPPTIYSVLSGYGYTDAEIMAMTPDQQSQEYTLILQGRKQLMEIGGPGAGDVTGTTTLDPSFTDMTKYPDTAPPQGHEWEWGFNQVTQGYQWMPVRSTVTEPKNWVEAWLREHGEYPGAPSWYADIMPGVETGQPMKQELKASQIGTQAYGQLTPTQRRLLEGILGWKNQDWSNYLKEMQNLAPPGGGGMKLQYAR